MEEKEGGNSMIKFEFQKLQKIFEKKRYFTFQVSQMMVALSQFHGEARWDSSYGFITIIYSPNRLSAWLPLLLEIFRSSSYLSQTTQNYRGTLCLFSPVYINVFVYIFFCVLWMHIRFGLSIPSYSCLNNGF